MEINRIIEYLSENDIEFENNVPLAKLTTFKVGGPVMLLVYPHNTYILTLLIKFLKLNNIGFFIMGRGSNLLCSDNGYNGIIIKTDKLSVLKVSDNKIIVGAGVSLANIASTCLKNSLHGFEFAALIPGSIGGAIYMNAGAYGGEMKDIVKKVAYLDENCNVHEVENKQCEFAYRNSIFSKKNHIILLAMLEFSNGDRADIKEKMQELASKRKAMQPLNCGSAGSTFKRPTGNYAATLIDECGLKGYQIGGAQVSTKHAGFIVNKGNASSDDILKLIEYVKTTVYNKTKIMLELEVKII